MLVCFLFVVALGIASGILWSKFTRKGTAQFSKYDKDHSTITVLNTDEVISKLSKISTINISNIQSKENRVDFLCKKNAYSINNENGTAYIEYDFSARDIILAIASKRLIKKIKFWKSVRKAMQINEIMDTLKSNCFSESKEYKKINLYAKAAAISLLVSCLVFALMGFAFGLSSTHDTAISEVKKAEFSYGVTYGELIDGYIRNAEWTAFNSDDDTAVVEVCGTSIEGEQIRIQFWGNSGMGFSYSSISLAYFEADGVSLDEYEAMEYIYWYLNE